MKSSQSYSSTAIVFFIFIFLSLGIAGYYALNILIFAWSPPNVLSPTKYTLDVTRGINPNFLTQSLVKNGIIQDGRKFILLGKLTRQWKNLKAGEYEFTSSMSPMEIFSILSSGLSVAYPLTIREGENFYEIANDLQLKNLVPAAEFLKLCMDLEFIKTLGIFENNNIPLSLEGYLYPETYFLTKTMSPREIIRQMTQNFQAQWTPELNQRLKELGFSRHKAIILASMIEKETGAPEERSLISSVFHNRLNKKMRLQSDPTTIYGIWSRYRGKIHKSDLFEKNDYNTYTIPSLPIGPIGNPGKEAIFAALYPTQSSYLYFVSHNDGTHEFTTNYEDHHSAVKKFQLDPKAREGKSWRDLKKRGIVQPILVQ